MGDIFVSYLFIIIPSLKGHSKDALRDLVQFAEFKKRENTHGGVPLLVKFQAYFTKSNTPL